MLKFHMLPKINKIPIRVLIHFNLILNKYHLRQLISAITKFVKFHEKSSDVFFNNQTKFCYTKILINCWENLSERMIYRFKSDVIFQANFLSYHTQERQLNKIENNILITCSDSLDSLSTQFSFNVSFNILHFCPVEKKPNYT